MPLSSGPTLFLAPSPIAWQAMHLLKEVLPAAASCASAAVAAADDAMTTSALRVSFFMGCSSWLRGGSRVLVAWHADSGQAAKGDRTHDLAYAFRIARIRGQPVQSRSTQSAPDVLDLS